MSTNLLNTVLFTVLGDPISLAKLLAVAGLGLDIVGVLLLLAHDLRTRQEAVHETDLFKDERIRLKTKVERVMVPEVMRRATEMLRPNMVARETLRTTRLGFRLILGGFILQLLGTLIS